MSKVDVQIVELTEHHSSCGTVMGYKTDSGGHHLFGLPLPSTLREEAGRRYKVTWEELPRNPKVRPTANPWRKRASGKATSRGKGRRRERR